MNKLISVIVPIYKVEAYLSRCIDSILRQTYQQLDIILVDDGSPDNCGAMCDAYADKDSRIQVIHKTNGGLSDARNAGLDIALGEYIYFVDSDDWIADDTIATLLANMDKDTDIVMGCSVDVQEAESGIVETAWSIPLGSHKELNQIEAMRDNLLGGWAAWNKLYRRELFRTIRFPVGRINEDEAILLHVLALCNRVVQVGCPTYYYFLRQNSITTSSFSEKKMDWFHNCQNNYLYIQANYPELLPEAEYRMLCAATYLVQFMLLEPARFSQQLCELKHCLLAHRKCKNTYITPRDKRRQSILTTVLRWRLGGLYRLAYRLTHKS